MAKTTEKPPVKVPEEDQGSLNPLAGVLKYKTPSKRWFLEQDKIEYEAFASVEEDKKICGWEVKVNGHYAGSVYYDPTVNEFFHFGLRQQKLDGGDSADRVGKSSTCEGATKQLFKAKWPKEYNEQTSD